MCDFDSVKIIASENNEKMKKDGEAIHTSSC